MNEEIAQTIVHFIGLVLAVTLAGAVVVIIGWVVFPGRHQILSLLKNIFIDLPKGRLTPEKINIFFAILFALVVAANSVRDTISSVLKLPDQDNPIVTDSVLLFLLMLGSLWIAVWAEYLKTRNGGKRPRRGQEKRTEGQDSRSSGASPKAP